MRDPQDPREPAAEDDLSIVPGLVDPVPAPRAEAPAPSFPGRLDPALDPDRYDPLRADAARTGPLDLSQDPDRYDPSRDTAPVGRLDPALDPDRYDPAAGRGTRGRTLPELLGEGAFEEKRDGYEWALGLLGVVAFIALVSWFFTSVVSP